MFSSGTERVITQLVDQVHSRDRRFQVDHLGNGSRVANGMLLEVELEVSDPSIEDYDDQQANKAQRFYYVVFTRNVSVFVAQRRTTDGLQHFTDILPVQWDNTSNHDSCWRSDGMRWLNKAYFEMCEEVNPDVAPVALKAEATLGFLHLWRDVTVNYSPDSDYGFCLNSVR